MLKIALPTLALVLAQLSCSDDDGSDSNAMAAPESPFLTAEDLAKPTTLTSLSAADVKEQIFTNMDLFENEAQSAVRLAGDETPEMGDGSEGDSEGSCIEELTSSGKFKVVDGSKVIYAAAYDLSSCFKQLEGESQESPMKMTEVKGVVYTEFTCDGADLSALDGKTLKEVGEAETTCAGTGSYLLNNSSIAKGEVTFGEQTKTYERVGAYAESTADNTPCAISKEGNVFSNANPCRRVDISEVTFDGKISSEYLMTLTQDLKWEEGKRWYNSGKIDVTMNDWTGTVTYNGQTAPSYSFSRAGETITGTVGVATALHALSRSHIQASLLEAKAGMAQEAARLRLRK